MESGIKSRIVHILKNNSYAQFLYIHIMSFVFRLVGLFIATDDKLVLMNGHGYKYNDSPRAIYEKMKSLGMLKTYKIVWALNNPENYPDLNVRKVKMDTWEYFLIALKAKYWISCVNIERGLHFKKKETIYLNTWHGAFINLCGNAVENRDDFHWNYINYFCACSDFEVPFIERDFGVRRESIIKTGYPRNDELYQSTEEKRKMYRRKFGIPNDKKVIVYAPTWRETSDGGATYKLIPPIDWELWKRELGDQYVILLRTHPYTTKLMNVVFDEFVRDYSSYPEINHLLIVSDLLISDYSSTILDYAILEKPIICFGYDYSSYNKKRGFYYDLDTTIPGGVVENQYDVIKRIQTMDYDFEKRVVSQFKKKHMEYGGNATIQCINMVFGTNYKEEDIND